MIVTVSELRIRNFFKMPVMIKYSAAAMKQAQSAAGNLHTWVGGGWLVGYTITAWESMDAMKNYRNSGAHKEAMRHAKYISSKLRTYTWETEKIPSRKEAFEKLKATPYIILKD